MIRVRYGIGAAVAVLSLLSAGVAHATAVSLARTEIGVDFVSGGIGGLGTGPGTGTIAISGISGTVRKGFLYWHGIDGSAIGAGDGIYDNATITLNGTPVTGLSLGDASTNCWGAGSSRGFFADVTNLVLATGNGNYVVDGLNAAPGHSGNGASLIVMFDDGNPSNDRDLVFFEGNDSDISDFPETDPNGWQATLNNINYGGGSVFAQAHVGDGQDSSDDSVSFASGAGTVTIPDTSNLWDGNSTPSAGASRSAFGSMWDIHTFDISGAFGAPGNYTLDFSGMADPGDCHSLTVMMIDLATGAAPCGNGTLDQGEECDPNESVSSCVAPESCLTDCTCGCANDFDCNDGVPCTEDSCNTDTGACIHDDSQCGCPYDCGDPAETHKVITAVDAGYILRTSVQLEECPLCVCDLDDSGFILSSDALADLRYAVGLPQTLACPAVEPAAGACCNVGECTAVTRLQCQSTEGSSYQGDGTSCDTIGVCSTCGNADIEPGEQCDDGNTVGGDGCDADCQVEGGTTTTTYFSSTTSSSSTTSTTVAACVSLACMTAAP